jgi:hypothetical protein
MAKNTKQQKYRIFVQDVGRHGYSAFKGGVLAFSARDAVRKVNLGIRESGYEPLNLIARLESSGPDFGLEDHGMSGLYPRKR